VALKIEYDLWKKEFASILKTLGHKNVIVLFSGGKDSSAMLDLFDRASREFDFSFQVHAGLFPKHRYPQNEIDRLANYWQTRDIRIVWHTVDLMDTELEKSTDPCKRCQEIRKNMLKIHLKKSVSQWPDVVLVISYSLWDLVSYIIENVLQSKLAVPNSAEGGDQRLIETGQRFYPLLKMVDGYQVFRPLVYYNDQDIESLITSEAIPTLTIPCAYKNHRPKRILGKYYTSQGLWFDYQQVLAFAREALGLAEASAFEKMPKEEYLGKVF
jgi:tRNA(Ile)-lysidine synthase TilS/MesJ